MARYYPVSPLFWSDVGVQQWGDREKLLALYLLTCEHRNLEGLYRLPHSYIAEDLGWELEDVRKAMQRLIEAGFIRYDEASRVVFVCRALKYQAPKSARQVKGAIASLQEVPDTPLLDDFLQAAERWAPELYEALVGLADSDSNGYRDGSERRLRAVI